MADAEYDAGRCRCSERRLRVSGRGAKRLLAEDVLAGRGCRRDLGGMVAMGRAQDHGVDVGACERILIAAAHRGAARCGCGATGLVGVDAQNEVDGVRSGKLLQDGAAPPAQTDDGGADHDRLPILAQRAGTVMASSPASPTSTI